MSKKIEMIGREFGRWTVKAEAGKKKGEFFYKCECSCGTVKNVNGSRLRHGGSQSCGCLRPDATKKALTTHGKRYIPEYRIWADMIQRCTNPKRKAYINYGGRGITIYKDWMFFELFYKDMGARPSKKYTLERTDNNKGYCKENCKWATYTEQARNQRLKKNNKTGVSGVRWNKKLKKYQVGITANYKHYHLGTFDTKEEAISIRKSAEREYWCSDV